MRPGAAPIPGSAPVGPAGAPGQVRPPVHVGPVAGRGRGDWRPLQKSFHPGFGPVWGNNTSGRGLAAGWISHFRRTSNLLVALLCFYVINLFIMLIVLYF